MSKYTKKKERRNKIRRRIRSTIRGTADKPRLCVYKSNAHVYAQLINDLDAVTLASVSTNSNEMKEQFADKSRTEAAEVIGGKIAEQAKEQGIEHVVFDRSGYKYHGVVKALADGAREGGLDL
jgi:large subunit ribosomal protein L18